MAYTTIDDPSEHFNTILYTGNNSANRSITGAGLQPDWGWLKQRNGTGYHELYDSSRGVTKALHSNTTDNEVTTSALDSFDSDGITVSYDSSNSGSNGNGKTVAWWLWKANGGTTSSNTDGSITSTVQANTTAGFSIVTYTGTGSNATIGHGLGATPTMMLIKNRTDDETYWIIYHKYIYDLGSTKFHVFPLESASLSNATVFNSTAPTSSVFSVGTNGGTNGSSKNYVAYCFSDTQGYQKAFNYIGNGNADGTFVYTGFKTAWIMLIRSDSGRNPIIYDNTRNTFNPIDKYVHPNLNSAETANNYDVDFLSNGFKLRNNNATWNGSDGKYVGLAMAEHPFVSSKGVPVTAG